jgi:hypothetical protein
MAKEKTIKDKAAAILIRCSEKERDDLKARALKERKSVTALVRALLGFSILALAGCGRPSAVDVCSKLTTEGVATGCKSSPPMGIWTAAKDGQEFTVPGLVPLPGKAHCFGDDAGFKSTAKALDDLAILVGPHRYYSPNARCIVQLNTLVSQEAGAKAKAVVGAL